MFYVLTALAGGTVTFACLSAAYAIHVLRRRPPPALRVIRGGRE